MAAGPVDGPAIFDKVKGCHISVAAQQLQVRGSTDSEFAVYSANKPTIEHSTGLAGHLSLFQTFMLPTVCLCPRILYPHLPCYMVSCMGAGMIWLISSVESQGHCMTPMIWRVSECLIASTVQSCALPAGWEHILV